MEKAKEMMGLVWSHKVVFVMAFAALFFFDWEQVAGAAILTLAAQWLFQGKAELEKTMTGATMGALAFFAFGWLKEIFQGAVSLGDLWIPAAGAMAALAVMFIAGMVGDSD